MFLDLSAVPGEATMRAGMAHRNRSHMRASERYVVLPVSAAASCRRTMLAGETAMTFDDILEQITTLLLEE